MSVCRLHRCRTARRASGLRCCVHPASLKAAVNRTGTCFLELASHLEPYVAKKKRDRAEQRGWLGLPLERKSFFLFVFFLSLDFFLGVALSIQCSWVLSAKCLFLTNCWRRGHFNCQNVLPAYIRVEAYSDDVVSIVRTSCIHLRLFQTRSLSPCC